MKIISKFRDYYDVVVDQYGVDEKIVFDRTIELPASVFVHVPDEPLLRLPPSVRIPDSVDAKYCSSVYQQYFRQCAKERISGFSYIVVCGRAFPISYTEPNYYAFSIVTGAMLECILSLWEFRDVGDLRKQRKYLWKISKEINSPIFFIHSYPRSQANKLSQDVYQVQTGKFFQSSDVVPRLADIKGFAKHYPAEQLYQDISYWVANVMNESPDVQPSGRPPQTDKEKIVSHGLDLKQSFRHRI